MSASRVAFGLLPALLLTLAACGAPGVGGEAAALTLRLSPAQARRLAAQVDAYGASDVNHLVVDLYELGPSPTYAETLVATRDLAGPVDFAAGVRFDRLKRATTYRARAAAFKAAGTAAGDRISDDAQSKVDVPVALDDQVSADPLPIAFVPRPFSAAASLGGLSVTAGGALSGLRGILTIIAGPPGFVSGLSVPASAALFVRPTDIAPASDGGLYVIDSYGYVVRKLNPAGTTVTFLAGSFSNGNTDGAGLKAAFSTPVSGVTGPDGSLYVSDYSNHRIRKITPSGSVTTLAGSSAGFVDGVGTAARFRSPNGLALDPSGQYLLVGDGGNHAIRCVRLADGAVTTIAGAGASGYADGMGAGALFYAPNYLAYAADGALYVTDVNNCRLRKVVFSLASGPVANSGVVTTVAGDGVNHSVDGIGTAAGLTGAASDLALGADNKLYFLDDQYLRTFDPATGALVRLGGGGYGNLVDGPVGSMRVYSPKGLARLADGRIAIADTSNQLIRVYDPVGGTVSTLCGASPAKESDGPGLQARLSRPSGLVAASETLLYVADAGGKTIRKLAWDGATWQVSTLAGLANTEGTLDGTGSAARFSEPRAIALGPDGLLYIAEFTGSKIRCLDPVSGAVTTFAGSGTRGSLDSANPLTARFCYPRGLAFDAAGNLFVSETLDDNAGGGNVIRRIDAVTRAVTTIAGQPGAPSASVDGSGSGIRLAGPHGIAFGPDGRLYVGDSSGVSQRLRRLTYDALGGAWSSETLTDPNTIAGNVLAFGPDGLLYTNTPGNEIVQCDPATGAKISTVLSSGGVFNMGGNTFTRAFGSLGLVFTPSGKLYATNPAQHCIYRVE